MGYVPGIYLIQFFVFFFERRVHIFTQYIYLGCGTVSIGNGTLSSIMLLTPPAPSLILTLSSPSPDRASCRALREGWEEVDGESLSSLPSSESVKAAIVVNPGCNVAKLFCEFESAFFPKKKMGISFKELA